MQKAFIAALPVFLTVLRPFIQERFRFVRAKMAHVFHSLQVNVELLHFTEHLQKIAKMAIAHVERALGADEGKPHSTAGVCDVLLHSRLLAKCNCTSSAKRCEEEVANCVNGDGCVAWRSERLREIHQGMIARINAHLKEEGTGKLGCMSRIAFESATKREWELSEF